MKRWGSVCFGAGLAGMALSACGAPRIVETPPLPEPYPMISHPCEMFQTTAEMRHYWLGIADAVGPDIRVRMPVEYIPSAFTGLGHADTVRTLDGALALNVRPLDMGPQKNHNGFSTYPDGHIDPARPKYKFADGQLLLKGANDVAKDFYFSVTDQHNRSRTVEDIIAESVSIPEHPALRKATGDKGVNPQQEETYFHLDEAGEVESYMYCTRQEVEDSGLFAHAYCTMRATVGPAYVRFGFDRDFLPEWHELDEKLRAFVTCAVLEVEDE